MLQRLLDLIVGKAAADLPASPTKLMGREREPRPHHYLFAHRFLPALFYADPARFLAIPAEEGSKFLQAGWEHVGTELEDADRMPAESLHYETRELENSTTMVIISLPEPLAVTEAYFVASVYRPSTPEQEAVSRFFTLEYGMSFDKGSRTVFCEWTSEKLHLNLGDGPDPTPAAFFQSVRQQIQF